MEVEAWGMVVKASKDTKNGESEQQVWAAPFVRWLCDLTLV
jgi:hypothetical protein